MKLDTIVCVDPSINTPGIVVYTNYPDNPQQGPWFEFYGPDYTKLQLGQKLWHLGEYFLDICPGLADVYIESQVVDGRTPNANSIVKCALAAGAFASTSPSEPMMVPLSWKGTLKKEQKTAQIVKLWEMRGFGDLWKQCKKAGIPEGRAHNTIDACGILLWVLDGRYEET